MTFHMSRGSMMRDDASHFFVAGTAFGEVGG